MALRSFANSTCIITCSFGLHNFNQMRLVKRPVVSEERGGGLNAFYHFLRLKRNSNIHFLTKWTSSKVKQPSPPYKNLSGLGSVGMYQPQKTCFIIVGLF